MTTGQWTFAEIPPGMVKRDPIEAEFFVGEEDTEDVYGRTDGLVREVIQNALDAGMDDEPVRVRFEIHGPDRAPDRETLSGYLGGLRPHLEASELEYLNGGGASAPPFHWLVYEDFGTRGLSGDPARVDDPDEGDVTRNDFYWFWRNIGRSRKSGQDLGRWGLGKTVLPATSRINTMFGLTVRASDGRRLLMGQSVLKTHKHDGSLRAPEGFFHDGRTGTEVPMPLERSEDCEAFAKAFRLSRTMEPGLSVVVPYCFPRLSARELMRSVILHYFIPILRRRLIVEISGPDLPPETLEAGSIRGLADTLDWKGKVSEKKHEPPPFDLADWAIDCQRANSLHRLDLAGEKKAPQWSSDLFPAGLQERLVDSFTRGDPVAIRVPLRIEYKGGTVADSHFDAFLRRDSDLERGADHYIREGMTIGGVQSLRSRHGVRGLVLVDDQVLSSLLGDAEGPAHAEWGTGETRPDLAYVRWKWRVSFVKLSLAKLAAFLTPPPSTVDRDLLSEVFGIDQASPTGLHGRRDGDHGSTAGAALGDLTPSPRWYRLGQIKAGFKVAPVPGKTVPAGARLRVDLAYDLPGGNPLNNWSPFDFDLKDRRCSLITTGRNVRARAIAGNAIELTVASADFALSIRGFDEARDLYVKIDEVGANIAPASIEPSVVEVSAPIGTRVGSSAS